MVALTLAESRIGRTSHSHSVDDTHNGRLVQPLTADPKPQDSGQSGEQSKVGTVLSRLRTRAHAPHAIPTFDRPARSKPSASKCFRSAT